MHMAQIALTATFAPLYMQFHSLYQNDLDEIAIQEQLIILFQVIGKPDQRHTTRNGHKVHSVNYPNKQSKYQAHETFSHIDFCFCCNVIMPFCTNKSR
jgi:hypothetical protein